MHTFYFPLILCARDATGGIRAILKAYGPRAIPIKCKCMQATAGLRPVVASWTEAERQEILRRGKETKAQEDLRRSKIQVCM